MEDTDTGKISFTKEKTGEGYRRLLQGIYQEEAYSAGPLLSIAIDPVEDEILCSVRIALGQSADLFLVGHAHAGSLAE